MRLLLSALLLSLGASACAAEPTTAYFVDGYHGGVYGHYPPGYTSFLVEQLERHPEWKINLEIEPATWDVARRSEPEAYRALQRLMQDQSDSGRIEIVNPTYAQSYLFQSSGESVIRQFDYGIRELREHFPGVQLTTYASEEPCFTSCLPSILRSLGYEFAVLKNPNTCWGGYTSAYGGELVNWIGPDGTSILTVPRYECEALVERSCWQTTAFGNSQAYIAACHEHGIAHPIGMCLQDAGWRGGPWLGWGARNHFEPSQYVTWRDYIRNVTAARTDDGWRFSQEDVKPGLMWGAQVLQRIAQQSRQAEQRLLTAEKLAAMALIEAGHPAKTNAFDEAWHNVLLSQHHDCWIVPYNGRPGNTWADQVRRWTRVANSVSDLSIETSLDALLRVGADRQRGGRSVRLFNPTAAPLDVVVPVPSPDGRESSGWVSRDAEGNRHATQVLDGDTPGQKSLLVRAQLPPMGYANVSLTRDGEPAAAPVTVSSQDEVVVVQSDLYRIEFDPAAGGTIHSLVAKQLGGRELVDQSASFRFNELRGHFYDDGGFHSSGDQPAELRVVESGPLRATVEVRGTIAGNPFVQRVSVTQTTPVIDCSVRIDWQDKPRIGEFDERDGWGNRRRAAYDDRYKLLALFPVNASNQRIIKNAPFDVCESGLADTFYNSWESIKHNLILDWVDVEGDEEVRLALFSDHTTSYTHGDDFPIGLTLQYAGKGLWARDYRLDGPTEIRYALCPHAGSWHSAHIPSLSASWKQPPIGVLARGGRSDSRAIVDAGDCGWQIPAMFERDDALIVRLFNSHGDDLPHEVKFGFEAETIELVELDGRVLEKLKTTRNDTGHTAIQLQIPRFGIRTVRISGIKPSEE